MSFVKMIMVFVALLGAIAHAQIPTGEVRPLGQGLPLPWPFPWAKDCPVDWKSMEGRYVLSESKDREEIDLDITVIDRMAFKIVRVARYDRFGRLLADGFSFVGHNQRALRLLLKPRYRGQRPIWGTIQLFYQGNELLCSDDNLVPILTLETADSSKPSQTQYVLLRLVRN